ncbi:MAG: hypothetical protein HY354_07980 [Planctomycetes bacterium]|nr:hypothetical protein [Planctomycetota bacterium]
MIREDIVFSGTIGNLRIGRNVRIAGNFGFSESSIVPVESVIPKINRADMPVFDLP